MSTLAINEGGPSPEASASAIQTLLFTYFDSLLRLGYKRPLASEDIWSLPPNVKADLVVDAFEKVWLKEFEAAKEKSKKTGKSIASLRPHLRALWRFIGRRFLIVAIPRFFAESCFLVAPLILLYLIRYLSNVSTNPNYEDRIWYGYTLAASLFVLQVFQTLTFARHAKACSQMGYQLRTALIALNFKKMLKLAPSARARLTGGKIINILVSDTNRIDLAMTTLPNIYAAPYTILAASAFLIVNLGVSAVIGLAVLLIYLPCQNWIQKTMGVMRTKANKIADQRIRITSEAMSGIRVIKSYAWEESFNKVISDLRVRELKYSRIYLLLRSCISGMSQVVPALAMVATFIAYRYVQNNLDAATIFSSLSLFYVLRGPLLMIPLTISQATDAWIAVGRIEEILIAEELTDGPKMLPKPEGPDAGLPTIAVRDAEFIWASGQAPENVDDEKPKSGPANLSPTTEGGDVPLKNMEERDDSFHLRIPNIEIADGSLVAVIGTVGSGKSSFLQALVGEMKRVAGSVEIRGSLGWCPQQPWVLNQTVKGNVLFGQPFDKEKYDNVLEKCALKQDLKILPAGDQTEIGERGINLSGGQKQRLSLSRAVYFGADVILLDDPLSAVDAHVGRYLFDNCIKGALKGKTRVLVTHQLHFLPEVDRIIVLDKGEVVEDGTYDELMAKEGGVTRKMMEEFGGIEEEEEEEEHEEKDQAAQGHPDGENTGNVVKAVKEKGSKGKLAASKEELGEKKKEDGKLMQVEERQVGTVSFGTLREYVTQGGGLPMALLVLLGVTLAQVARILTDNWLAFWSSNRYDLSTQTYIGVYVALGLSQAVFLIVFSFSLVYAGLWSSQNMHVLALRRVLKAPVAFFDTTPLGRLITRFSRDVDMLDNTLPETFRTVLFTLMMTLANFGLIAAIFPVFLAALFPAAILFYFIQRYYSSSTREIRRLDSVTRSSLFAQISETLTGLATIRAYDRQKMFIEQNEKLLNTNGRMYYVSVLIPLWLTVRLEAISSILILLASTFAVVYRFSASPGLAGLTISYAVSITSVFNWCVRQTAETEQNLNSVERLSYLIHDIPQEMDVVGGGEEKVKVGVEVDKEWPRKGDVEFLDVEMRYRPELPLVLNRIRFSIKHGQKCGIVGRTGAGKSSILVALLRLVENASGSVMIDGLDISSIPLTRLRSSIAVIPQDPVLFSGTIRSNLDPFSEYNDDALWLALEKSDLKHVVAANAQGLDMVVAENGENFSTGQRQLICLARAMLRSCKIILLDEATASVDLATDDFIQRAIRESFADATVVTIAHRLNTVADYSKILVLSNGVVIEEGSPKDLLENVGGVFSKMVEETGTANAAAIRAIAGAQV
ncbi:hypothetical protein HDU97_007808 [Phlyctochytrium planicorne]|nr:hypothetical protein HDU97_007808 [Phlyctochytrium planicorne]